MSRLSCLGFTAAAQRFSLEHAAKSSTCPTHGVTGWKKTGRAVTRELERQQYDIELVLVDVARRKDPDERQASLHQWSPDGTRLAFIAPADGAADPVLRIDGGEAMQVSGRPPVSNSAWRRDGNASHTGAGRKTGPRRRGKANRSFEADELPVHRSAGVQPSLTAAGGRRRQ